MMKLFNHPLALAGLYLLLRVVLSPLSPVPGAVALDPLCVFAVLLTLRSGWLWVFALLPGLILGDALAGMGWAQMLMRSFGLLVMVVCLPRGGFDRQVLAWTLQMGLWSALMPDWMGWYPMGYVYGVWLLQGLLWWGVLSGEEERGDLKPLWPLLIAPVLFLILNLILPSPGFWPLPQLGAHSGLALQICAGFLVLPPLVFKFLNRSKPEVPERGVDAKPGRWTHLAE
ncbi:hypothetical protein P3T73_00810 [Kiritimatiellota bacterium B12222]|nr:hypothetical protein P3T73_00810 [Kiritimatiellota bacterium B12222]